MFYYEYVFYNIQYSVILGAKTPDVGSRTYTEIMREQLLRSEETEVSV